MTGDLYDCLSFFRATESEKFPDKDQKIYVYCGIEDRSKQTSEKLAEIGYTNVLGFGGIQDWNGEGEY